MQIVKDQSLIYKIIKTKFEQKSEVILWQNLGGGRRVEVKGKCYRIDAANSGLWFLLAKGSEKLEQVLPTYIYFKERKLIFKTTNKFLGLTKVSVSFPKEVQLAHSRVEERNIVLKLNRSIRYFLGREEKDHAYLYSARVYDESTQGVGLIVTYLESNRFILGDYISIKKENGISILAQVIHMHMKIHEESSLKQFHIGLRFQTN